MDGVFFCFLGGFFAVGKCYGQRSLGLTNLQALGFFPPFFVSYQLQENERREAGEGKVVVAAIKMNDSCFRDIPLHYF